MQFELIQTIVQPAALLLSVPQTPENDKSPTIKNVFTCSVPVRLAISVYWYVQNLLVKMSAFILAQFNRMALSRNVLKLLFYQ